MALISIGDAHAQIRDGLQPLEAESVSLADAQGRVLAQDVCADRDMPPFNRAMMDGFAVRAADVQNPPVTLPVVDTVLAGTASSREVRPGEAVRIMTGATVPVGSDAVQMLENTESMDRESVTVLESVSAGRHVAKQGSDCRAGDVLLQSGTSLSAARLGVCAMVGQTSLDVYRQPRVAILSTGDELVDVNEAPGPVQIRESNRTSVGALVQRAGAVLVHTAIVPDQEEATCEAIRNALACSDVLLLSGGISKGDRDIVRACLIQEGVTPVFHGVCIKPGKPLFFGRSGSTLVFGLPGNPVSSLVTARLFVVPALRQLMGYQRPDEVRMMMPLLNEVKGTGNRPWVKAATVQWGQGVWVHTTGGSGDMKGFARGEELVMLPANHPTLPVGASVEVLLGDPGS